jgi:hypothetical protein
MRTLDMRGAYFDRRTGDLWDLFFPGYEMTQRPGAQSVGRRFTKGWYFYADAFDRRRNEISRKSGERWVYSGGVDLVLINAIVGEGREVTIDWASTFSTNLAEQRGTSAKLTLAEAIERITHDLETGAEDATYGIRESREDEARSRLIPDLLVTTLSEIAAALASRGLGI